MDLNFNMAVAWIRFVTKNGRLCIFWMKRCEISLSNFFSVSSVLSKKSFRCCTWLFLPHLDTLIVWVWDEDPACGGDGHPLGVGKLPLASSPRPNRQDQIVFHWPAPGTQRGPGPRIQAPYWVCLKTVLWNRNRRNRNFVPSGEPEP